MELSDRDAEVVGLVGKFQQATASQIKEVLFSAVSRTMLERCLNRLLAAKYLRRIGRRAAGERGGSGAFVYQLGSAGWHYLAKEGEYAPRSTIAEHAVAVCEIFAKLASAKREGLIRDFDCRVEAVIESARSDMLILITGVAGKRKLIALEVEVTRKRQSYILNKCANYIRDLERTNDTVFPLVVFVVPHRWMKVEIERTLRGLKHRQELFMVCVFDEVIQVLRE